MAVNCSTGFRSRILGPSSFESIFNYGCIEVRTGAQPASADLPPTGTLVGRITVGGGAWSAGSNTNGLRFVRTGVSVQNDLAQAWRLAGVATGTAGWFRLRGNSPDGGDLSTTHCRVDGAIGLRDTVGDFQLYLPTLAMSASTAIAIPSWWFNFPPLG